MTTLHEQARAEAERIFPKRSEHTAWIDSQRRIAYERGYRSGHEAAARTRVVSTEDELDALAVGSVVLDNSSIAVQRRVTGWWTATGDHSLPTGIIAAEGLPARVLYDPEETR